ncbi:MAG TPA: protein kinase [Verrucomicrobiae bacterium]
MAAARKCPRCGTEVTGETLDGLCPQCLLGEGVALDKAAEVTETPAAVIGVTAPRPGISRFGDYELLEVIAHGGMGMVYKARQVSLGRLVALKMLLFGAHSSPGAVHRLRAEAMAAASLHHPNIVSIHEVGFCEGQHFLAMDYVEGRPLSALIAGRPLPPKRAATYLRTIAEAVHHAHERGILHRDLKPSNILIDQEDQPRITDFGLAKRLESDSNLTVSGQVLGSPNYMSPEQAGGKRGALTRRSDIYSLGAMLYELLAGRPPFIGDSLAEIVPQVLNNEPLAPRALNPSVPLDLQTVCLRCLEKDPEKRYPTALALAEDLGRFLEAKPVLARPVGRLGKSWRWCRRQPVRAALTATLIITFILGSAGILWQWVRAQANELRARRSEYAADISLAQLKLEANDFGEAIGLLDKYRPTPHAGSVLGRGSPDLRHWEWRYLRQGCRSDEWFTLHRCSTPIDELRVSSDEKFLAVREGRTQITVWDLAERRTLAELPARDSNRARNFVFVPGTRLLVLGDAGTRGQPEIALWDADLRREKERFAVSKPVRALSFSPNGQWLAALHEQGQVTVLDFTSKQVLKQFTAASRSTGDGGDLFFSRDGQRLVIVELGGRILVRKWRTDGEPLEIPSPNPRYGEVVALAGSPTEDLVAWASGWANTNIWLANFTDGKLLGELKGHTEWISALVFSPDGQLLASASADRTIRLWNLAERKEVRRFQGHADEVSCLGSLPYAEALISGGKEGAVRLWKLTETNARPGHAIVPLPIQRQGFAFAPDGRSFITACQDRSARLWCTQPLKELERLSFLGSNLLSVDLSADGRWLAAADARGKLGVWDWSTRRLITNLVIPPAEAGDVTFCANSRYLLAAVRPRDPPWIRLGWETPNWKPLPEAPDLGRLRVRSLSFSPSGGMYATGHEDGKVRLWTFPDSRELGEFPAHSSNVEGVAFSSDGRMLASAAADAYVNLWDVPARRLLKRFRADYRSAYGVCFSPDGRRRPHLASASPPRYGISQRFGL